MNHLKGGQLHSCGQLKIHCIFRGKEILVADPLESKDTPEKKKKKKDFRMGIRIRPIRIRRAGRNNTRS